MNEEIDSENLTSKSYSYFGIPDWNDRFKTSYIINATILFDFANIVFKMMIFNYLINSE